MAELVVICECGFKVRGVQDDVVARTQEHEREAHNMNVTREHVARHGEAGPRVRLTSLPEAVSS